MLSSFLEKRDIPTFQYPDRMKLAGEIARNLFQPNSYANVVIAQTPVDRCKMCYFFRGLDYPCVALATDNGVVSVAVHEGATNNSTQQDSGVYTDPGQLAQRILSLLNHPWFYYVETITRSIGRGYERIYRNQISNDPQGSLDSLDSLNPQDAQVMNYLIDREHSFDRLTSL